MCGAIGACDNGTTAIDCTCGSGAAGACVIGSTCSNNTCTAQAACTNNAIATATCKCGITPSCAAGKICATVPVCTDKAIVANQAVGCKCGTFSAPCVNGKKCDGDACTDLPTCTGTAKIIAECICGSTTNCAVDKFCTGDTTKTCSTTAGNYLMIMAGAIMLMM